MEFSSVTLDLAPPVIQPNSEESSTTNVFSCYQILIDLGGVLISLMSFSVFIILPLIEIVIGIIYRNACSMNSSIPIYLIIAGLISSIILAFAILGVKYPIEYFCYFLVF